MYRIWHCRNICAQKLNGKKNHLKGTCHRIVWALDNIHVWIDYLQEYIVDYYIRWVRIGASRTGLENFKTVYEGCRTGPPGYIGRRNRFLGSLNFKGAQAWDIRLRVFYINQTCMDRWLGTRTKNPKLGWFRPENRHFVLFSALGYSAMKISVLVAVLNQPD